MKSKFSTPITSRAALADWHLMILWPPKAEIAAPMISRLLRLSSTIRKLIRSRLIRSLDRTVVALLMARLHQSARMAGRHLPTPATNPTVHDIPIRPHPKQNARSFPVQSGLYNGHHPKFTDYGRDAFIVA